MSAEEGAREALREVQEICRSPTAFPRESLTLIREVVDSALASQAVPAQGGRGGAVQFPTPWAWVHLEVSNPGAKRPQEIQDIIDDLDRMGKQWAVMHYHGNAGCCRDAARLIRVLYRKLAAIRDIPISGLTLHTYKAKVAEHTQGGRHDQGREVGK